MEFYVVWDADGVLGYFENEPNAERCADYFEKEKWGDCCEPDKVHVYIYTRTFDDFYWTE